jgi:hypothetical protein
MRRRIRSAAFPVHRHSVPQLVVDGLLVALAYFLAYQLRFDNAVPTRYDDLLESTAWWVVPWTVVVLATFGLYQRLWTFVSQREYEAVLKGVIAATIVVVGAIALLHPVQTAPSEAVKHNISSAVTLPASVIAMFVLLALALLIGARFVVHLVVEGRVRSFRVAKGARDALIVGGGDGGRLVVRELVRNPQLRMRPVGFVDDDPRKLGIKDEYGLRVLGTTSARDRPRAGGYRVSRARDPGTHHADRVRAAQGRLGRVEGHPPASRGAGGGHPRTGAGADGGRARGGLSRERGRNGDRRRRIDWSRAVSADRPCQSATTGADRPR